MMEDDELEVDWPTIEGYTKKLEYASPPKSFELTRVFPVVTGSEIFEIGN